MNMIKGKIHLRFALVLTIAVLARGETVTNKILAQSPSPCTASEAWGTYGT